MSPTTKAILASWEWRIEILVVLALAGTLFSRGWWLLRQRSKRQTLATFPRLISYWVGLIIIFFSLISPIDLLAGQLFFMHMIQHLLLIMIAPPLLLVVNPMPFILWGLPTPLRVRVGQLLGQALHRDSAIRKGIKSATRPGIIWFVWLVAVFGWHDPDAYNAALRFDWIHDLEHLSFFISSMIFWWYVTGAGPHLHGRGNVLSRVAFVLGGIPPNMLTGIVLAMANDVVYTYYLDVPRLWQMDALTDQRLGGLIMWVPGSMMFIIAAIILLARTTKRRPNYRDGITTT